MEHWTIYYNPKDYPGKYVVRKWTIDSEGVHADNSCVVTDTLPAARAVVPAGLYKQPRYDGDDLVIVEVWF